MYAIRSYYEQGKVVIGENGERIGVVMPDGSVVDENGNIVITSYSIHYTKLYES